MNVGDTVKYAKPIEGEGESDLRFLIVEVNGDRGMIALLDSGYAIPPVELARMADLELLKAFTP